MEKLWTYFFKHLVYAILGVFGGLVIGLLVTLVIVVATAIVVPDKVDGVACPDLIAVVLRWTIIVSVMIGLFYSIFLTKKYPIFEDMHKGPY